jgi:predicted nucleotidyltransferase
MSQNPRLSKYEIDNILETIHAIDAEAEVYLFGSRVDSALKGGDIDLLIVSSLLKFTDKISILVTLEEKLGDQKIDVIIKDPKTSDPFILGLNKLRLNHSQK